jgi:outer membrane protein TolC
LQRAIRLPLVLALGLLAVELTPRVAFARRYTLVELLARVNADYPGVRAARAGLEVAAAQQSMASRLRWPTGSADFWITGSPETHCQDLNVVAVDPKSGAQTTTTLNCANTDNRGTLLRTDIGRVLPVHGVALGVKANLTQPLYTFGKIDAARHAADAGAEQARAQMDKDRGEVALNAMRAYWGLKLARAAYATLDDGIGRLKEWVKKINDDIEAGKSTYTETDLIRLKLALDQAQLVALDFDKGRDVALAGLRAVSGDPQADVDEEELDLADVAEQPLGWYEDAALSYRPDVRMLAAAGKGLRAAAELQRAQLWPDIGIIGSFNYSYVQSVDDPHNAFWNHPNSLGFFLALGIHYDLQLPEHLAQLHKAHADESMLAERRRQALGGVAVEIETNWLEARATRRKAELLAHSEKVARGWYNAVDQSLQVGVAESRDLVDAARNYFELRVRHLQSIMDVNMAAGQLKFSAGVLVK